MLTRESGTGMGGTGVTQVREDDTMTGHMTPRKRYIVTMTAQYSAKRRLSLVS